MMGAMVALALLLLTGCTSAGSTSAGGEPGGQDASPASRLKKVMTAYAACLERNGLEVSAPHFDHSGKVSSWPSYEISEIARRAERSCGTAVARLAYEPRGAAALFLEWARPFGSCMRRQGVPVDVTPEGIHIPPGSSDREIRRAERVCRYYLEDA